MPPPRVILGLSGHFHDSAAALLIDGRCIAAAAEERFTRRKHEASFPKLAAQSCLQTAGLTIDNVDIVAWHEKPLRVFERVVETHAAATPFATRNFADSMATWCSVKGQVRRLIRQQLQYKGPIAFSHHHLSHAASAIHQCGWDSATVVTIDGVGQWSTTTIGQYDNHELTIVDTIEFPHSIGLLYSAATAYLGFKVNDGEYKTMGLAAYGRPRYAHDIRQHLVQQYDDGSYALNMPEFAFIRGRQMHASSWNHWLPAAARQPNQPILPVHHDIAASFQMVVEDLIGGVVREAVGRCGCHLVAMAGGVALNCVAITKLLQLPKIEAVHVQPAAGDAGGALGAALVADANLRRQRSIAIGPQPNRDRQRPAGPSFTAEQICDAIEQAELTADRIDHRTTLHREIANHLADGKVVARFNGPMEFGPRALGHRSLLADPRNIANREHLNRAVKNREPFRPFAPAVLSDHTHRYFTDATGDASPTMTRIAMANEVARAEIPAAVHVDGTCRLQTLDPVRNEDLYGIVDQFRSITGVPAVINTSFNVAGAPIVCTPQDAIACFRDSPIDVLAIGPFLLRRRDQRPGFDSPQPPSASIHDEPLPTTFRLTLAARRSIDAILWRVVYYGLFSPVALCRRAFGKPKILLADRISSTEWTTTWTGKSMKLSDVDLDKAY